MLKKFIYSILFLLLIFFLCFSLYMIVPSLKSNKKNIGASNPRDNRIATIEGYLQRNGRRVFSVTNVSSSSPNTYLSKILGALFLLVFYSLHDLIKEKRGQ